MAKLGEYGKLLKHMSKQEVFDVAAEHLLKQRTQSKNEEGECVYNGQNVCCAAAPFIKDYEYGLEGDDWHHVVNSGCASDNHQDFIILLQHIHDDYSGENFIDYWYSKLKKLAKSHSLNTTQLEDY